jgi:hypothetical protein
MATRFGKPHGMMEKWNVGWNTGYEKRKKVYSTTKVVSAFYDDTHQTPIFCPRPRKYATITRKSIQLYAS